MSAWVGVERDFLIRPGEQYGPLSEAIDAMADLETHTLNWLSERMSGRGAKVQSYGHRLPMKLKGEPFPIIVHRALGPDNTTNLSFGGYNAYSGGKRTHVYTVTTDAIVGLYEVERLEKLTELTTDLVEIFDRLYCANQYLQGRCNYCVLVSGHTTERIYYGGEWWWAQRLKMELSVDYNMRGPDLAWQSADT